METLVVRRLPAVILPVFGQPLRTHRFSVEIGLNPIETAEGTWVLSAIVDITERMRAEERAQKRRRRSSNAQKLESLGVLAGASAHDFNNLLSASWVTPAWLSWSSLRWSRRATRCS